MAEAKKFCVHSDGYGRCDLLSDGETREYCVEGPCPHEEIAEYAPVVHGRWIPSESDFDDDDVLFDVEEWCDWQCSACHDEICYEDPMERRWLPKFCNNCGAKMDVTDINVGGKGGEG